VRHWRNTLLSRGGVCMIAVPALYIPVRLQGVGIVADVEGGYVQTTSIWVPRAVSTSACRPCPSRTPATRISSAPRRAPSKSILNKGLTGNCMSRCRFTFDLHEMLAPLSLAVLAVLGFVS
jgi:hypothetical protein